MAKLNQPLYNQKPNLGKHITVESGSYKDVHIYEFGVLKSADPDAECSGCGYYNSNGSWVSDEDYCDDEDGMKNTSEELAREFNYVVSHPASPILAPILWGDESEFIMAKVQVASDLEPKIRLSEKALKRKTKGILLKVLKMCSLARTTTNLNSLNVRYYSFNTIIKFGLEQKLTEESIAKTVYHFLRLDASGGIMSDMHDSNFGLYKNRIVAFDLGLAGGSDSESLKRFLKNRQQSEIKSIKRALKEQTSIKNQFYYDALKYKREKKLINFEYRDKKYFNAKIIKVQTEGYQRFVVSFDNGLVLSNYELRSLTILNLPFI